MRAGCASAFARSASLFCSRLKAVVFDRPILIYRNNTIKVSRSQEFFYFSDLLPYHQYMDAERMSSELTIPGPSRELLERIHAGEQAAFAVLVREYQPYAYALALRLVWDRIEAEDVVQESFVRVWRHIGSYRADVKFTTWLYAIVTRLSIDRIRSVKRRERTFVRYEEGEERSGDGGVSTLLDGLHNARLVEVVGSLVVQLPHTQRIVFTLRDLQDLPMDEVAVITGMSATTMKANLWHARRRMRELLAKSGMTEER